MKGSYQSPDYLVSVISQEILFDGEVSTITYFRDVTFGMLYK